MKKIFLLDAYALIYRAYYAFMKNPRINSKGLNTSAILGFTNTLEDILRNENPTHIGVAFDPQGPTFRHEAYEAYKAQREATPEVIRESVPIIKDLLQKAYNIPVLIVEGYEADDVIGTMAKKAEKEGFEVYMMTPDKDYGQLVSENIKIYKPNHGGGYSILGPKEVIEKYNIKNCEQVIDLLGLMGDASDNIPGCPGVGEKTAIKLLNEFGSCENIIENIPNLKGAIQRNVENNIDKIKFSKFLATIKIDVPIEFDEKKLERKEINKEELIKFFTELEFKSLINRYNEKPTIVKTKKEVIQPDLFSLFEDNYTETKNYSNLSKLTDDKFKYYLVDNKEVEGKLLAKFNEQNFFCFDTETTGISPIDSKIVGISFSFKEKEAFYVPISKNENEAQKTIEVYREFFENEKWMKIGQNIKFDLMMLRNYNIKIKGKLFDTMLAHYILQPELQHSMDYLAETYLNYQTIHIEELIGPKGKNQLNMGDLKPEQILNYAAEDADITLRLYNVLKEKIKENDLEELLYKIETPLIYVLADMEMTGVCIDNQALKDSSLKLREKLSQIEQEIYELAGEKFNINSPKQVGEILFEKLKINNKAKKTKTGQYSTSEEILESMKDKHPIIGKILEMRGLNKLLGTYIEALPELINKRTNHIHTSFNQAITATGRLSSSNPNLQNIPIRDDMGKEIRKAFIPEKGEVFVSADYSQIELRLMAHLSQDKNMIEDFLSDNDIHKATAAKVYKIGINDVTSDMRRKAKTANFGIIYGISVFGLSERLTIPRSEAKELIEEYFKSYPEVQNYMENCKKQASKNGYVETLFKRKRFLPDINSQNSVVRGFAERNAINAPIQGTAADIIKLAMINIHKRLENEQLKTKMIIQVHDELNFSVPKDELEKVKNIIKEEMEGVITLSVPLKVEIGEGSNWLEAH